MYRGRYSTRCRTHRADAARGRPLPPPGHGPHGAVLRRYLRFAARRAGRSSASRGSATSTPGASASTWSRRTCSTSCSSRCPTTTRTPTSTGLRAGDLDRRRRTASSSASSHAGGRRRTRSSTTTRSSCCGPLPRRPSRRRSTCRPPTRSSSVLAPFGICRGDAEIAVCPASAQARWSTRCCPRAATRWSRASSRSPLGHRRRRPRALGARRRGEGAIANATCETALRPRRRRARRAGAGAGRSTARSRSSTRAFEDGVLHSHAYPDALGRAWSAFDLPDVGRRAPLHRASAASSPMGGVDHVGGASHGSRHRVDSWRADLLRGGRA